MATRELHSTTGGWEREEEKGDTNARGNDERVNKQRWYEAKERLPIQEAQPHKLFQYMNQNDMFTSTWQSPLAAVVIMMAPKRKLYEAAPELKSQPREVVEELAKNQTSTQEAAVHFPFPTNSQCCYSLSNDRRRSITLTTLLLWEPRWRTQNTIFPLVFVTKPNQTSATLLPHHKTD